MMYNPIMTNPADHMLPPQHILKFDECITSDPYISYGEFPLDAHARMIRREYLPYSYMVRRTVGHHTKKTVFIKAWQKAMCDRYIEIGNLPKVAEELQISYETVKEALRFPSVWAYYLDMLGLKCFLRLDLSFGYTKLLLRLAEKENLTIKEKKRILEMMEAHLYGQKINVTVPKVYPRSDGRHRKGQYGDNIGSSITIKEE